MAKSDLKVQNRTLALGFDDDNNNSENVANQPLYGKSYLGKGNGVMLKLEPDSNFQGFGFNDARSLCVGYRGMLAYAPALPDSLEFLREPPLPTAFTTKVRFSSQRVEPGYIKTSSLKANMSRRQQDFWHTLDHELIIAGRDNAKGKTLHNEYGKFHILALEKMICASDADSKPSVAMELQQRLGLYFTFPQKKTMIEIQLPQTFITPVVEEIPPPP